MSYLDDLKQSHRMMRLSSNQGASEPSVLLESTQDDYVGDLTLEDLEWGCRATILEFNSDPVLVEYIKSYSQSQVMGMVFEKSTRDRIHAAKLRATDQSADRIKRVSDKYAGGPKNPLDIASHLDKWEKDQAKGEVHYNKRMKKLDALDAKARSGEKKRMAAGVLTVAAVTAIAYAAYKKYKNKDKKKAAQAAAAKSNQLADQAKKQGKDKAAAKAKANAKQWEAKAKAK